ncbi:exodeoxyribonuclease III [Corynebacterium liangguodongii]|uniref:Exodeoxyribonuclease III n=1 Tax=Corynebacterium liangguodongii TaxID=2079535 RepID=A0A2S0WFZ1_9CORY|nr:exodeoxyribonuclease III [Corynebacterium liangguodongii]AWB84695.1 exodeoxyribonuclease III [Corynebacterium liangguodongii]PWB99703.1 exodeoxyribonuclease III [Corynebacterium liangguodongii]
MRIATWNVNSVRSRAERIAAFLKRHDVDVLAMQETKTADEKFPYAVFEAAGYEVAHVGVNQWNGVAIASRVGLDNVRSSFPGQPAYEGAVESRAVGATCGGIDVWSLYVPNGREIGHPHYNYKLAFLYALARAVTPSAPQLLVGDFNIAPRDTDVWDIAWFEGKTHVTEPERAAFEMLLESGVTEITHDNDYTFWDYKAGRFGKNQGMLIDFMLATDPVAAKLRSAWVDVEERAGKGASDHAPLIADFDTRALDLDEVR